MGFSLVSTASSTGSTLTDYVPSDREIDLTNSENSETTTKEGIIITKISEPNPISRSQEIETETENNITEKPPENNYYKYLRTITIRDKETKKENT